MRPALYPWEDEEAFLRAERDRRVVARGRSARPTFFLSHCHRGAAVQSWKRGLVSALGAAGTEGVCAWYWADFLDLSGRPAVNWRAEIRQAIAETAKFVALIDAEYLMSFNCMDELGHAVRLGKPVLAVVISAEASAALCAHGSDACERAWEASEDLPGCMDREQFVSLWRHLQSVNLMFCRARDAEVQGVRAVQKRFVDAVHADVEYMAAHNELGLLAGAWHAAGRPAARLLSPEDAERWRAWLAAADGPLAAGAEAPLAAAARSPAPHVMQRRFVEASVARARLRRRRWRQSLAGCAALSVAVLVALAALSFLLLVRNGQLQSQLRISAAKVLLDNSDVHYLGRRAAASGLALGREAPALFLDSAFRTVRAYEASPLLDFDLVSPGVAGVEAVAVGPDVAEQEVRVAFGGESGRVAVVTVSTAGAYTVQTADARAGDGAVLCAGDVVDVAFAPTGLLGIAARSPDCVADAGVDMVAFEGESVAFSPDGAHVAVGGVGFLSVRATAVAGAAGPPFAPPVLALDFGESSVRSLAWTSPVTLAAGGTDRNVTHWALGGALLWRVPTRGDVNCLAAHGGGLLAACDDGELLWVGAADGASAAVPGYGAVDVTCVASGGPAAFPIVAATGDKRLHAHASPLAPPVFSYSFHGSVAPKRLASGPGALFSATKSAFVVALRPFLGGYGVDGLSGADLWPPASAPASFRSADSSPDGERAAGGTLEGGAYVWGAPPASAVAVAPCSGTAKRVVRFSHDSSRVAFGSDMPGACLSVHAGPGGAEFSRGFDAHVRFLEWSPADDRLAVGLKGGAVAVVGAHGDGRGAGVPLDLVAGEGVDVGALLWTADGWLVASHRDGGVRVFSESGAEVWSEGGSGAAPAYASSMCTWGARLAAGFSDGRVNLREFRGGVIGAVVWEIRPHVDLVLAVHAAGARLVAASEDETVSVVGADGGAAKVGADCEFSRVVAGRLFCALNAGDGSLRTQRLLLDYGAYESLAAAAVARPLSVADAELIGAGALEGVV